jgi:4-alpha-glucanotransferase
MKIQFYLRFYTKVGQDLFIIGDTPELGNGDLEKAFPLQYLNNEFWVGAVEIDSSAHPKVRYKYFLKNADGSVVPEWANDRKIELSKSGVLEIQTIDTWNHAGEFENVFFTSAFQQALLKHNKKFIKQKPPKQFTHVFKVKAPLLKKSEQICLSGSSPVLGEWNTDSIVFMSLKDEWWTCRVALPKESYPLIYKYGVYNFKEEKFVQFEQGENRLIFGDAMDNKITIIHDGFAKLPNNTWHGAGVAIPIFSLRTKNSFGVGEFSDLKLLVTWARKTSLKLIQLLPVNDTIATHTWIDSYPYAAISAFALHPMYINLEKLAGKNNASLVKALHKKYKSLNELPDVDYVKVTNLKLSVVKELYTSEKQSFLEDPEYLEFFAKNKHWLVPYAAFCCLRDRYGTCDFTKWKQHSIYNKEAIEKFASQKARHYDSVGIHYFTQYHLHCQLQEATDFARKHGLIVKGDIPIGIYRYSCDAWVAPELYHMDFQAGAPPDDFAAKGQNWGFPTYNWEQMAKDGFDWWKKRLEQMSYYFDAFRFDHILGFFRIWSIPMNSIEGVLGYFSPAIPVHVNEFMERNIPFNHHRYTRPFINDAVLWEIFETEADRIKTEYLIETENGFFELQQGFNTQRKVEQHFNSLEKNDLNQKVRQGLYDLIANVILFEVDQSNGQQFHFHISIEKTSSFRYLEWQIQQILKDLYVNYFFRRQDHFWMEEAMKKLPAIKSATNMLVCGEDLGMVPDCVPDVMKQTGILSLEIQRMPKDPKKEFSHPGDAPYLSVVTPSTHDMSTIRGWWEEDPAKTQRFFNSELGQWGDAPQFCEPWINKTIVLQHLYSPAIWSIFQLQDLFGMSDQIRRENPGDERINVPSNSKNLWRYRMHMFIEELIEEKEFNEELKGYIHASGRD